MKILILSDLHLEHKANKWFMEDDFAWPEADEYDVAALVGDISSGLNGIEWAKMIFANLEKPIIYIPGNHEYYIRTPMEVLKSSFVAADGKDNIHVLNPGVFEDEGITIIGATLWSQALLSGYPDTRAQIQHAINDFRIVQHDHINWFNVAIMQKINAKEVEYIQEQIDIAKAKGNKVVVMTHFVPSQEFADPKYVNDPITPYFINDLDYLVEQVDLYL